MKKIKFSILMPVFNEGVNLKIMLKFLKAALEGPHEVLIIYDFPEDDSVPVVKTLQKDYPELRLVHNKLGKGVSKAIRAGINEAKGDYALILTADDTGPLLTVEDMLKLMDKGCDLVNCTRYSNGGRVFGGSPIGRQLSRLANKLFYVFGPSTLTDSTIGIKMLRVSKFKDINFEAKSGWSIGFELAIRAQAEKMNLGEVPITSINRFYGGESSFSLGPWFVEYTKWFFKGLKKLNGTEYRKARVLRP